MKESNPNLGNAQELTINAVQAQLRSFAYFLSFALIFGFAFYALWPQKLSIANYKAAFPSGTAGIASLILIIIAGVIVHELIHGIIWARYAASGFRSIRFGILWKSITPYCHCKEPLKVRDYQIGAAAPGIILGILPSVVALFLGNILWLAFGLFFTMAAGGDLMIILMLNKQGRANLVQDHPSKIGCLIYPKEGLNRQ